MRFHYNVSNEFYRLWLDRHMVYSCGYFKIGEEGLDTAQEQKLDLICRKLRLGPGEHFLDIGCGWGSLVLFMLFELVRPLLFPLMLFVRLELVLLQFFLAQSGACDPA